MSPLQVFNPKHPITVTLVDRVKLPEPDEYGNDVFEDSETQLSGCAAYPRYSTENNSARAQVIVGITLLAPYGSDVASVDAIEVRGVRYEVDGEPGEWDSQITGNTGAVEVALKRITG